MRTVAIIGGGPAGLAAAYALHNAGIGFTLFDEGAALSEREHDRAEQLGIGIGGAGLFSDGKFSFYPSGTNLYTLDDTDRLSASYAVITGLMRDAGIDAPPFPALGTGTINGTGGAFHAKDYSSSYGTLAERTQLIDAMSAAYAEASIRTQCSIERIDRHGLGYALTIREGDDGPRSTLLFSDIIVASGRFGGVALRRIFADTLPFEEQRYELGIRIEHPNSAGFLKHSKNPDVKFILRESEVEVRTFCTCRHGEVWMIPYAEAAALSGRSDGPPSNYSNFGLLPRFTGDNRSTGRAILDHFRDGFPDIENAMWQPLPEFLDGPEAHGRTTLGDRPWHPRDRFLRGDIAGALHPELSAILKGAIRAIVDRYPDMYSAETVCLFPALEGVGHFPETDGDLRIAGENIWCCGDVVGAFRGLIPALVSGHYAGITIAGDIARDDAETSPATVEGVA